MLNFFSNLNKIIYRVSKKKIMTHLAGYEIKNMKPIFKTETLIYLLKANLDDKIFFGKIIVNLKLTVVK